MLYEVITSIDDRVGQNIDASVDYLIVVFNASNETQSFTLGGEFDEALVLHPLMVSYNFV